MGLFDRPRAAALAAQMGWRSAGLPPGHVPLQTMDNRQMMELHRKDLASSPLGSMFGGGWQSSLANLYRAGPSRLRALANSYGGTQDAVSWVFACTSLVASTLASYPWRLEDDAGETVENPPEDLLALLKRPNPKWTYFDLMEMIATDLELVGNSYLLKNEMNALGKPLSLYRLRPDCVRIALREDGQVRGYIYTPQRGLAIPYESEEIIHFKYPNPLDDYYGMGTVEAVANQLDQISNMNLHITGFFQNGARISGVLTVPETMTDTQFERLKQSYMENYAGPANAYKILIAEGTSDYKPVVEGPATAGVVDLSKLKKDEVLAGFGVPAPLLGGVMENANYKMEESQHIFTRAMIPRTRRTGERFTTDLIGPIWGLNLAIDAHANEPLEVRIGHSKEMLQAGATLNQALDAMGQPSSDHPLADVPLIPNSLIPIDLAGAPPRPGRSIPMGTVGEPGSPMPGQEEGATPPTNGHAPPASLSEHLADLPAALGSPKALQEFLDQRIAAAISAAGKRPEAEPEAAAPTAVERTVAESEKAIAALLPHRSAHSARSAADAAVRSWDRLGGSRPSGASSGALAAPAGSGGSWVPPEFPRGFEAPSAKAAERADHRAIREHQARTLRVGVDTFEPLFRKFFKAQRDRVLGQLSQFGAGERSARLRATARKAKDELTTDAIFDLAAENAALEAAYLPALDEVGTVAAETPPSLAAAVSWDVANPRVADMRSSMGARITQINDTTRSAISDVVQTGMTRGYSVAQIANGYPDEKYPGVMGVFDQASDYRAEMIARTESAMTFNGATALSYRDATIEMVEVLDGEGDEECADANGSVWTLDDFESNPLGHPNCSRCCVPSDQSPSGEGGDSSGEGE